MKDHELFPGFIDLQVNGYRGVDFSSTELTEDSFVTTCRALAANGTAGFLPTIITAPADVYERNLGIMKGALRFPEVRGVVMGFHLEGPFISPEEGYRGAHPLSAVREPDPYFLDQLQQWSGGGVKLLTVAAEARGATDLIRHAVSKGIRVSLGHHRPNLHQLEEACRAGATGLTHMGNGLPRILDRHPNPIWDGLACGGLTAMVIPDGHHVPDQVLKTFFAAKGTRIFPVSDASPVAGMAPGRYEALGNKVWLHENGRLENPDTGLLVGSSFTMLECMNHLAATGWFGVDELSDLGTVRPLGFLGMGLENRAPARGFLRWQDGRFHPEGMV